MQERLAIIMPIAPILDSFNTLNDVLNVVIIGSPILVSNVTVQLPASLVLQSLN